MIDLNSLDIELLGNPVSRWAAAGILALVLFTVLVGARAVIGGRLARRAADRPDGWEATARALTARISTLFILILAVFCGAFLLDLPATVRVTLFSVVAIVVFIQAALIGDEAVAIAAGRYARRASGIRSAMALIRFLSRLVIWSIAALLILDNLGFDITALVAGLGIGGIAIALAAQNVLSDLFASLAIILDKPFVVGDFIIFDGYMGTVEKIGIKTTRLRSLSGEELICANADLLATRIRNYRDIAERRSVFAIGIVYETPYEKIARVPGILKEIVEGEDRVRFDRAHFASFGDFSLNFEVVYNVLSAEYQVFMDVRQSINLKLFKRFEEEGIEFAYPTTRTVGSVTTEQAVAAAAASGL